MKRLIRVDPNGVEHWEVLDPDPLEKMLADPNLPPPVTKEQAEATAQATREALAALEAELCRCGDHADRHEKFTGRCLKPGCGCGVFRSKSG